MGVIPPVGQGGRMPALTLPSAQDTAVAAAGKLAATFLETVFCVDQRNREALGIGGSHSSLPPPPSGSAPRPTERSVGSPHSAPRALSWLNYWGALSSGELNFTERHSRLISGWAESVINE